MSGAENWSLEVACDPHPPIFVSVASKGVAGREAVSVAPKGLKVSVFHKLKPDFVSVAAKGFR